MVSKSEKGCLIRERLEASKKKKSKKEEVKEEPVKSKLTE